MIFKDGVVMAGLDLSMRPVLIAAENIWMANGRPEGVCITSALDGCHSAGSLHYYGLALDLRTRYFDPDTKEKVFRELCSVLDLALFDIVWHETHIHVEYDLIKEFKRA